jgi:phosphosulfolactate phosphohydrolase-like enzyme
MALMPPSSGLIAMRIGQEFGPPEEFARSLARALERGGQRGATIVAILDRGDLVTHIPQVDGPSWNSVPLVHLHRGQQPSAEDWAVANAIVERLERYR